MDYCPVDGSFFFLNVFSNSFQSLFPIYMCASCDSPPNWF